MAPPAKPPPTPSPTPPPGEPPKKPGFSRAQWITLGWYVLMTLLMLWFWQATLHSISQKTIPYSEFKQRLAEGQVEQCTVATDEILGQINPSHGKKPAAATTQEAKPTTAPAKAAAAADNGAFDFRTVRVDDPNLVSDLEKGHATFTGERPSFISQFLLSWILPIGLIWLIWWFLSRRMRGMGQSILGIGASKAKMVADTDTGVTFDDVAGCDEAKYELTEVVDFLRRPEHFRALGAQIPKGVLLVGPPGTGKTLLARAVAGEAHVPFFSISGSEFVEMFVGVGAARVRDLFEKAKAKAPCIIFIDELDAVGRQRGVTMGVVNDEREQTLNQLLVGMDGFEPNEGVVVLAATNRPEVLDKALLRPGRFDRQVVVDAPDMSGREAILKLHARNKPLELGVDFRAIAQETPGFSGADLANVINEAALLAARRDAHAIAQDDLQNAVEKVVAGPERKSRRLNPDEKRRVAYHETGHALVSAYCKHADMLHKISVVPHGHAALGYTLQLPEQDRYLMSASELTDKIKGMLGGRAAEEVIFTEVSTGPENDLEHATALARQMVCVYGMSKVVGLAHLVQSQPMFAPIGGDGTFQRDCSEATAREVDEEVKRILDDCYNQAKQILQQHHDQLDLVATELLKTETMDAARFKQLIGRG
ncbi:MAG TPA: ATP-dependent zinc metalloprotease FtsH [Tepidisphaeraceae bacterium]|jgi:cell division protease FtsH|nr:ATP-dependent zinc metalloprotease FtsH [Tepidisphaeraceae bacterium]